ncbi:MAG: hypothetical protein CL685_01490 [Candidatus Magasanikbacteria bacterium]|nr:hypothetical protein [Candidatus Magasanikbacteria bacterium]
MKIAIIGTHSTGKTSIIQQLSLVLKNRGKRVFVVTEVARRVPGNINENAGLATQLWIQEKQKKIEATPIGVNSVMLCDRSIIDNFAYLERVAGSADISGIEKDAVKHIQTYDFIFKTKKLDVSAVADGVRSVTDSFRDNIEERIVYLLQKHAIDYNILPGTLDAMHIVSHIEHIIAPKLYSLQFVATPTA